MSFVLTELGPAEPLEAARQHRFGLSPERWERLARMRIWVTGAGTGFGQQIALALLCAGAQVILSGRREAKLAATLAQAVALGANPQQGLVVAVDLCEPDSLTAALAMVEAAEPRLSGIVHAAAIPSQPALTWPATAATLDHWQTMFDTNLRGPWFLSTAALNMLRRDGHPRILMLGSEAGWAGSYGVGLYNVAKTALNGLVQTLAHEYAVRYPDLDLQINLLVPGEARTEMNPSQSESPSAVIPMALTLISQPPDGPNGCFFHRDGRHFSFGYTRQYAQPLKANI